MCLKLTLQLPRPRRSSTLLTSNLFKDNTHLQMKTNRHVLSAREEFICGGAQDISSARLLPPTWWSRSHQLPKVGALHLDASWFSLLQEESSGYGKCTDTTSPSHQDFLLQCWASRNRGAKRVTEDGPRSSCACAVLDIKPRVVCLFGKCLTTP